MLTVIFYHAGVPWLRGGYIGVDVFFVISGFLITGGLVDEVRRSGRLSLADFYVRRIARILPAATLAIVATVALSWLLLPVTRWTQVGKDAVASSLYVVNWMFAHDSVDYVALDQAPSPLQHMWSLAVEEQFYIVWPLLLLGLTWLLRGRVPRRRHLAMAVGALALPSLAWSVLYTGRNLSAAYFVTTTRVWELAIGAGVAVVASGTARRTHPIAPVVGWLGLVAVVSAAVRFSDATPFPSYWAVVPTLGTAALIWSGSNAGPRGPARLLSLRPMAAIGSISYSLYLWHWPLLVILGARLGGLSTSAACLVVLGAMLAAWLSTRYVEKPAQRFIRAFRGRGGRRSPKLALGLALMAVGVVAATGLAQAAPSSRAPGLAGPIGAETLAHGGMVTVRDTFSALTPAVTHAARDLPAANSNGCMVDHRTTEPHVCSYGARGSSRVIALVGDSHAAMYIPALALVARDAGYRLDTYTKGSCPPVDVPIDFHARDYSQCRMWADNVFDHLVSEKPALVITAMSREYQVHGSGLDTEASRLPIARSLADEWRKLLDGGIKVAGIRDVPRPGIVVPDCVAAHIDHLSECAKPEQAILPAEDQIVLAAQLQPRASVLDFTSALCGAGVCPAVIGRVIVYRDSNHLTATYVRTMRALMSKQIQALLR